MLVGILVFHSNINQASSKQEKLPSGILGGPETSSPDFETLFATMSSQSAMAAETTSTSDSPLGLVSAEDLGTLTQNAPIGTFVPPSSGSKITTYIVQSGDTLTGIAHRFGVSLAVLRSMNPKIADHTLRIHDQLAVSAESHAHQNTDPASAPGYFIMPVDGLNWGILHHYNAVDIAAPCGTPVVAAADGLVIPDSIYGYGDGTSGWNGGYGKFVLLQHPTGSGVKTRYAHLEKIIVPIGDYAKQGDVIGLTGETGDATGCHVHFEVYGAKNPFAK